MSNFTSIRFVDDNGLEYWTARDLMVALGYSTWQTFGSSHLNSDSIVRKSIAQLEGLEIDPAEHFTHVKPVGRTPENWLLTRKACFIIASNSSSTRQEVSDAKSYFSSKFEESVEEDTFDEPTIVFDKEQFEFDVLNNNQREIDRYCLATFAEIGYHLEMMSDTKIRDLLEAEFTKLVTQQYGN